MRGCLKVNGKKAAAEFFIARFSRLYPLYGFLLMYYKLFPMPNSLTHGVPLATFVTLTQSWWYFTDNLMGRKLALGEMIYGWSWTISAEFFFYIVYGLVLYRLARLRSPRLCVQLLLSVCVFSYLLAFAVYHSQGAIESYVLARHPAFISVHEDAANSFLRWLIYFSPYMHFFEFLGGCLLAQLYFLIHNRKQPLGIKVSVQQLAEWGAGWILCAAFLESLLCNPRVANWLPDSLFDATQFFHFLTQNYLMTPGCYMLILACALGGSTVGKQLSRPFAIFFGECSYSLYLAHPLVRSFTIVSAGERHAAWKLAIAVAMVFFIAAGLYTQLEVPARRYIRRQYSRWVEKRQQTAR